MTMFNPNSALKAVIFISGTKWYFKQHIQWILNKTRKIIGSIRKLQPIILRRALLTIFTSFLTPHLDYGDIMYDHTFNEAFQNKLVCSIWCPISNQRSYQRFLKEEALPGTRSWNAKIMLIVPKTKHALHKHPYYLLDVIPKVLSTWVTRNYNNIILFNVKHEFSFCPSTAIE